MDGNKKTLDAFKSYVWILIQLNAFHCTMASREKKKLLML